MQRFIDATRAAVDARNWYAAIALALTMPDICGKLEMPLAKSQPRFVAWFDRYLLRHYQAHVGAGHQLHTFLSGADCYALRCAFLHQGEFGIDDQRARSALEKFHFTAPQYGRSAHKNQRNNVLQLQADCFCIDVCLGVQQWLESVTGDVEIQARMAQLARID